MNWNQIIPIILGAVLAITTTFFTKFFSDWYEVRSKRIQITRYLASELSTCVSKIDSLLSIYLQSKEPAPTFLVALERATELFTKHREAVYLLDSETSQKVLEFYDCVDQSVEVILSMLRLAIENKHREYAFKEIQKQMSYLENALSLGQNLLTQFKFKDIQLSQLVEKRELDT
jgi:hypothetical protein